MNQSENNKNNKIYRISFLKAKEEQEHALKVLFKQYEESLSQQEGFHFAGLFQSFFSFPQRKADRAYVLVSEWTSLKHYEQAQEKLLTTETDKALFNAVEVEEQYLMQTEHQQAFSMVENLKKGYAIEFAARQIKPHKKANYSKRRTDFMQFIKAQRGFAFDQEFKALNQDIDILLFGWKSVEDFQLAGKKVKRSPIQLFKTLRYFTYIKQKAFQVGKS